MSRPIVVCLGDSLTAGENVDGVYTRPTHAWPALLDVSLFPDVSFANFGAGGERVDQMLSRFNNYIKGLGFKTLILWGGINDILQGRTGAAIWADMNTIITAALADGMAVILVHTSGFGGYVGWTSPRQAELDALRVLMAARTGVTHIDLYQPQPVGLNDPAVPNALHLPFSTSDELHINPVGVTRIVEIFMPVLRAMYPAPVSVIVAPTSLNTPTQLKARYPEMTPVLDAVCQAALDDANEEINEAVWGVRAIKGEAALAAHFLVARGALNDPSASGMQGSGPIQHMRVGDVSVSFDVNAMARAVDQRGLDMALSTTKYGLEYTRLLNSLACGGAVTTGGDVISEV